MEAERTKKPGSVRLTDAQYEEMERLGVDNESAYVKYKLSGAQQHLQVLRREEPPEFQPQSVVEGSVADQLAIQRLSLENDQLKSKLNELSRVKEETLSGLHSQVEGLLRDELLKRDFDALKKENTGLQRELEKAEKELAKSEQTIEEKSAEIEELVKKLGLIELGKVLLPGAINGLANRYPQEMQGLASTLGSLSGEGVQQLLPGAGLSQEQQNLLNIAQYFRELFNDEQFEQVVQLVTQLGEQVEQDSTMINKVIYYLNQMAKMRKAKSQSEHQSSPDIEQTANG